MTKTKMDPKQIVHEKFPRENILISVKATVTKGMGAGFVKKVPIGAWGGITRMWGTLTVTDKHFVFVVGDKTYKFVYTYFACFAIGLSLLFTYLSYINGDSLLFWLVPILFVAPMLPLMRWWIKNIGAMTWNRSALDYIDDKNRKILLSGSMESGVNWYTGKGSMWLRIDENFDSLSGIIRKGKYRKDSR